MILQVSNEQPTPLRLLTENPEYLQSISEQTFHWPIQVGIKTKWPHPVFERTFAEVKYFFFFFFFFWL